MLGAALLCCPCSYAIYFSARSGGAHNAHRAVHDSLTGLPNRLLLRERMERELRAGGRRSRETALMIVDLDRFKAVNDALGHGLGDRLLEQVGPRLRGRAAPTPTARAARWRRVRGCCSAGAVRRRARPRARGGCSRCSANHSSSTGIAARGGASIGVACFPEHGDDGDGLLRRADVAMYVREGARSGGRGYSRRAATATGVEPADARRRSCGAASSATSSGSSYQPKLALRSGPRVGVEALARWDHPRSGGSRPTGSWRSPSRPA